MVKKTGIWRFAGPLRITALLTAIIYGLLYAVIWSLAWLGETEIVYDLVDVASQEPLTALQVIGGMICTGLAFGAMVLIAIAANKFLKTAYRNGFFEAGVARTLKHLGYGLVLFYIGLMLSENFMPWLLTKNLNTELREEIEWFLLDPNLVALLVGFVLLLLSGAMDEAREIDADNKQII